MTLSAPRCMVVLLLGLVVSVSGNHIAASTQDEGSRAARGLVTFKWLGPDGDEPGSQRFVLRNESALVVRYYGYDSRLPHHSVAMKVRGGWRDLGLVYCGTGSGLRRLEPGATVEFSLRMREHLKGPLRIGITVTAGDDLSNEWTVFAIVTQAGLARLSN